MSAARTPIANGVCQGDFDFAGHRALNLDLSGSPSGAPFFDDTGLIRSSDEATALAHFKLDWNTPGVHRVFTLPNYNGQVATLDGIEDLTNKTVNGITFSGVGGFSLNQGIVSIAGELLTDGLLAIGSGHQLILQTTGDTGLVLPLSGTLATTAQIPVISDVAYNATTWNGNLDGASKNAIRDKFESLSAATSLPFDDDKDLLKNVSDPTKLFKISLAGLTTGTTRTLTAPDKNGTIACLDDIPGVAGIIFDADQPDRTLYLAGNASFFGSFSLQGGYPVVFEASAITDLVLPEEGTLATRAGAETFTNKTIVGGSATLLEELSIQPAGLIYPLRLEASTAGFTSARKLTLIIPNADTSLTIGGDFAIGGAFLTNSDVYIQGAFNTGGAFTTGSTFDVAGTFFTGGGFSVTSDLTIDGGAATLRTSADTDATFPAGTTSLEGRVNAPANAGAFGVTGQVAYDTNYEYRCVATNTWKRVAISTW